MCISLASYRIQKIMSGEISVLVLLPLLLVFAVTTRAVSHAATDRVQVVSFRKSRTLRNGPVMCALDVANKTMSPSSLQDCSLSCTNDESCTGFNTKNSSTCDLYNYEPHITVHVSNCTFYQVSAAFLLCLCSVVLSFHFLTFVRVQLLFARDLLHVEYVAI